MLKFCHIDLKLSLSLREKFILCDYTAMGMQRHLIHFMHFLLSACYAGRFLSVAEIFFESRWSSC